MQGFTHINPDTNALTRAHLKIPSTCLLRRTATQLAVLVEHMPKGLFEAERTKPGQSPQSASEYHMG